MSTFANNFNIEDVYVTEKDKNSFEYLKKKMDYIIAQEVYEKQHILKARNLYEGKRDPDEFKYLEETFGIETPLSIKMTPLIKTRVDVLVGILLEETFSYKISINDKGTVDKVKKAKLKERAKAIMKDITNQTHENIASINAGQEPKKDQKISDKKLKEIDKVLERRFISGFEIAAQSLVKFFEQDSTIDLKQKMKQFFLDLLVTGEAYYRTYIPKMGADPVLEICKPENVFYSKNTKHQFIASGNQPNTYGVVHREYMTRGEILNKYGHFLDDEGRKRLFGNEPAEGAQNIISSPRDLEYNRFARDYRDYRDTHNQYSGGSTLEVLPVYHVEWLANNPVELSEKEQKEFTDVEPSTIPSGRERFYDVGEGNSKVKKKGYRLDRYEGIRIGYDLYVNCGRTDASRMPRSEGQPFKTTLSYNGATYNERNGKPYSLSLALKDIQDSYDIMHFFRDNLVANSGVNGSRINMAAIPKALGDNFMERLFKFMALRKQGVELIDPTEPGAQIFSGYGDFKASISSDGIAAINAIIEGLERQADILTGVNRHMYQAAEQRDAVSNVKVGVRTGSLITKDLFELLYTSQKHALEDLINQGKLTYKKGKRGSYILGNQTVFFDLDPKNYCFTDFNIHVVNSSKETIKLEKLNALATQLVGAGTLDSHVLLKLALVDSTTEVYDLLEKNMEEKEEENNQLEQLNQALEQMEQTVKQYEEQLNKLTKENEQYLKQGMQFKERELEIKSRKVELDAEIAKKKQEMDEKIATAEIAKDQQIVQLEREQLYAEEVAGNAREIKDNI